MESKIFTISSSLKYKFSPPNIIFGQNKPRYVVDSSLNFAALLKRSDFKWEVKESLVNPLKYLRAKLDTTLMLTRLKQALNSVHSVNFMKNKGDLLELIRKTSHHNLLPKKFSSKICKVKNLGFRIICCLGKYLAIHRYPLISRVQAI